MNTHPIPCARELACVRTQTAARTYKRAHCYRHALVHSLPLAHSLMSSLTGVIHLKHIFVMMQPLSTQAQPLSPNHPPIDSQASLRPPPPLSRSHNSIGATGASALSSALAGLPALHELYLRFCDSGGEVKVQ